MSKTTKIMSLNEDGVIEELTFYTVNPLEAMVNFIYQNILNNYNTWNYDYEKMVKKYNIYYHFGRERCSCTINNVTYMAIIE